MTVSFGRRWFVCKQFSRCGLKHFQITEAASVSTLALTRRASAEIAKEIRLVPKRRKLNIKLRLSVENQFGCFFRFPRDCLSIFSFSPHRFLTFEFGWAAETPFGQVTVMFLCFLSMSLVYIISSRIPSEQLLFRAGL